MPFIFTYKTSGATRAITPGAARMMPWTTGIACLIPLATENTFDAVVTAPMALFMMGLEFDSTALLVNAEPAIFFLLLKLNGSHKDRIFGQRLCRRGQ